MKYLRKLTKTNTASLFDVNYSCRKGISLWVDRFGVADPQMFARTPGMSLAGPLNGQLKQRRLLEKVRIEFHASKIRIGQDRVGVFDVALMLKMLFPCIVLYTL